MCETSDNQLHYPRIQYFKGLTLFAVSMDHQNILENKDSTMEHDLRKAPFNGGHTFKTDFTFILGVVAFLCTIAMDFITELIRIFFQIHKGNKFLNFSSRLGGVPTFLCK